MPHRIKDGGEKKSENFSKVHKETAALAAIVVSALSAYAWVCVRVCVSIVSQAVWFTVGGELIA